jgi:hypothetical protein
MESISLIWMIRRIGEWPTLLITGAPALVRHTRSRPSSTRLLASHWIILEGVAQHFCLAAPSPEPR